MNNISLTERKILYALSLNARSTLSEIAHELKISRQAIRYTLNKLERTKVIEGYYAIFNIFKLGYLYHRIFFRFRNFTPQDEKQIIDHFLDHKNVGWVCQYEGDWDLAVAIWTQSMGEFESVLDAILSRMGDHIEEKQIAVPTQITHLRHDFLVARTEGQARVVTSKTLETHLNDMDYDILGILAKTCRKTYRDIGTALELSPKVVKYRIDKLMEMDIILGFNIKINHRLLGLTQRKVFLTLTMISEATIARLTQYLKGLASTVFITKVIGMADLEFELMVKSNEEFYQIMKQIRYEFPNLIRKYSSIIVSQEPCINYLPLKK